MKTLGVVKLQSFDNLEHYQSLAQSLLNKLSLIESFLQSEVKLTSRNSLELVFHKYGSSTRRDVVEQLLELENKVLDHVLGVVPFLSTKNATFRYAVDRWDRQTNIELHIDDHVLILNILVGSHSDVHMMLAMLAPLPSEVYAILPVKRQYMERYLTVDLEWGRKPRVRTAKELSAQLREALPRSARNKVSTEQIKKAEKLVYEKLHSNDTFRLLDQLYKNVHDLVLKTVHELSKLYTN